MIQHCLWKVLSETGLIQSNELTEMESRVLKDFVRKSAGCNDSRSDMTVLNRAIDKIVLKIKDIQLQSQNYRLVVSENNNLKSVLQSFIRISEPSTKSGFPLSIDRPIEEIGLSRRTVRLLKSFGIDTLEQLRASQLSRLRIQARVGVKTIHEIETILSNYSVRSFD